MSIQLCWYCEKNQAVSARNYPHPHTIARFAKTPGDENTEYEEILVPRCLDCASVHAFVKFPAQTFGIITAGVFIASIAILPNYFSFSDDGFLLLGACLPTILIVVGMFMVYSYLNRGKSAETKGMFDITQYPPVAAVQEQMELSMVQDPLSEQEQDMLAKALKEKGTAKRTSPDQDKWVARLKESGKWFLNGVALAGMGALGLELTGAMGEGGAVVISGGGALTFLPIGGALLQYLSFFSFGLMAAAGAVLLIWHYPILMASLFMSIVKFIRNAARK